MARSRLRLAALALALGAALAAWWWSANSLAGERVQMVDAPCPARPLAEESKPVRLDWVELCRYQAENARLIASGQPVRVVLLGDSITEWWSRGDPALFSPGVVNRGITGQTSQQLVLRFRQDVLALKPRVVQFQAGLNDIMGMTGLIGPDAYIANFETLLDLAEAHGIVPIIASLPPAARIPDREEIAATARVIDLNRRLKSLAERRGAIFADYHAALAGPDAKPRPGLSSDGAHLTQAGYAALRPVAQRALADAEARAQALTR
jgi:lysophospholipase L1-like esterase